MNHEKNDFVLYYYDGITIALGKKVDSFDKFQKFSDLREAIDDVKFGEEIQPYKTGSINSLGKRIELFSAGVSMVID